MKATVEIADALFAEAEKLARDRDITFRELVECGLRKELRDRAMPPEKFVWKDLSWGSGGLRPPFTEENWTEIREASYERHDGD
jgi:hypothetical protein